MAKWLVTPNEGVEIGENGRITFPANEETTDKRYIVSYMPYDDDDSCVFTTEYIVHGVEEVETSTYTVKSNIASATAAFSVGGEEKIVNLHNGSAVIVVEYVGDPPTVKVSLSKDNIEFDAEDVEIAPNSNTTINGTIYNTLKFYERVMDNAVFSDLTITLNVLDKNNAHVEFESDGSKRTTKTIYSETGSATSTSDPVSIRFKPIDLDENYKVRINVGGVKATSTYPNTDVRYFSNKKFTCAEMGQNWLKNGDSFTVGLLDVEGMSEENPNEIRFYFESIC